MRYPRRPGFTLVELLVALLLIDVGILALVSTTAMLARQQTATRSRIAASQLGANRIQQLIATPCASQSGTATGEHGETEHWTASLLGGSIRDLRDSVAFVVNGSLHAVVVQARSAC